MNINPNTISVLLDRYFPATSVPQYPPDTKDHWGERNEFYATFGGKNWKQIVNEKLNLRWYYDTLEFVPTADVWLILPAILYYCVTDDPDVLLDSLVSFLSRRISDKTSLSFVTNEQFSVILIVLELLRTEYNDDLLDDLAAMLYSIVASPT